MVLAMAAFAIEDMLYKAASQSFPAGLALILFGAQGTVLFAALSVLRRERILHPAILTRPLLIRTGFELGGRLFYALALALTPLASTSSILQATPLVVALGAVVVFGETVGWRRWLAMSVGFAGVLLILRPTPDSFEPYSLFAVLGMIGFAGRDLATRASPASMSMAQLGTLGFGVVTLAGIVLAVYAQEAPVLPPLPVALKLAGAAGVGVLAYGALTQAMRTGQIGFVAPFRYTRLVFALILAVLVFGERPDQLTLIGGAVIVGSGLYSLLRQRKAG
ncbi:DMT family transporter [Thalassobius vesicularis]|uniref:DMT family transporter n=2 Tax=Thalassobius vesicularis TaxID=1294297 RepID=A0A4S3M7Z9_9RHOB|nr:DMT family transporter [Thalassobius vesicularis]